MVTKTDCVQIPSPPKFLCASCFPSSQFRNFFRKKNAYLLIGRDLFSVFGTFQNLLTVFAEISNWSLVSYSKLSKFSTVSDKVAILARFPAIFPTTSIFSGGNWQSWHHRKVFENFCDFLKRKHKLVHLVYKVPCFCCISGNVFWVCDWSFRLRLQFKSVQYLKFRGFFPHFGRVCQKMCLLCFKVGRNSASFPIFAVLISIWNFSSVSKLMKQGAQM